MGLDVIPAEVLQRFRVEERRHACAILATDFVDEFSDLMECLRQFELLRSEINLPGGRKSRIAERFDQFLASRGFAEKQTDVAMTVDGKARQLKTHHVDLCRSRVAIEVEWNNKDPFFARDLDAFRLLHQLDIISVGVIITRSDKLQDLFDRLGWVQDQKGRWQRIKTKYGQSTTHWSKLMPHVEAGAGGACPLLLIGIGMGCYRDDIPDIPIVHDDPTV